MKKWKKDIIRKVRQAEGEDMAIKVWFGFKMLPYLWEYLRINVSYHKEENTLTGSFDWGDHPYGAVFWVRIMERYTNEG